MVVKGKALCHLKLLSSLPPDREGRSSWRLMRPVEIRRSVEIFQEGLMSSIHRKIKKLRGVIIIGIKNVISSSQFLSYRSTSTRTERNWKELRRTEKNPEKLSNVFMLSSHWKKSRCCRA